MLDDFNRLKLLLDRRQAIRMSLLFVGLVLAAVLEMIGLGSIPLFVALLADPDRLLAALAAGALGTFGLWLRALDPATIVLYGASALALIFVLKNIFLTGLAYAEQHIVRDVTASVSNRLFRSYLLAPYTFHLGHNPATLVRNTTTDAVQAIQLVSSAMKLLRETLVLAVVFILLLITDPLVSLSVFLTLGLATAVFYLAMRSALSRRGQLARGHRAAQVKAINQGLGAIKEAKLRGSEPQLLHMFDREVRGLHQQQAFQRFVNELPRLFLETLAITAVLLVSAVFVVLGRPMEEMLPVLSLLAVAVVRAVPAFTVITRALTQMRFQRPSLEKVVRDLSELERERPLSALPAGLLAADTSANAPAAPESIRLENLHFRYPGADADTLAGISLDIRRGESVGIIGPSGSGKSTLTDVILGLLEPTSGRVLVDGEDIHARLAVWQRRIGYVPQDIYLLDDTIRRNIAFGVEDPDVDASRLSEAVRAANLEPVIECFNDGLETVIGNRGIRLSGGQRQRIAIARALYAHPGVLVLDEATSALDNETEKEVVAAIDRLRGERTIITIAHRITTLRDCDRLYLLANGRIERQGSYADLAPRVQALVLAGTEQGYPSTAISGIPERTAN